MTRIRVTASRSYDVLIQPGLLDRAGEELRAVLPGARSAAAAADETDRKSVVSGKSVGSSVDLGGRRIIKKSLTPSGFVMRRQAPERPSITA